MQEPVIDFVKVREHHKAVLAAVVDKWLAKDFNPLGGHPSLTIERIGGNSYRASIGHTGAGYELQTAFHGVKGIAYGETTRTSRNERPGIYDGGSQVEKIDGRYQASHYFYVQV